MARLPTLRFIFQHRGTLRKFASVYVGRDNSFYVRLNRPSGQPWRVPHSAQSPTVAGNLALDFDQYLQPSFDLNKISLHPSGFMSMTDTSGKRFRDGIRAPRFSEMVLPFDICLLVPCAPSEMPLWEKDRSFPIRLDLPDQIEPFYTVLSVISAASPPEPKPGPLLEQHPVNFLFEGHQFGFALSVWPVVHELSETVEWPPFPFFALLNAA